MEQSLPFKRKTFFAIISLLFVAGCVFVYAASSIYALERYGSAYYFVKKQMFGAVLSLCAALCFVHIPLTVLYTSTPYLFGGSVLLTLLTITSPLAIRIHGSSRWLNLGFTIIQPSELLKVTCILWLAYALTKCKPYHHSILYGLAPLITPLLLALLILLKQPDFGLTTTLVITTIVLLYLAQWNPQHLFAIAGACLISGAFLIALYPYRMQRLATFLNPWKDPSGAGFQIIQSLIAIGSGGWVGAGLGQSKQKFFYLPMQHTDFIFSIIAEEVGFIGGILLLTAFLAFLYFGLSLACTVQNRFGSLSMVGFVLLLTIQATINLSVATGLVPTKGIGLPFISYGNSALVSYGVIIGIIGRILYEQKNATS